MGDRRRLALVVGSQCQAMPALSFLPDGPGPVDIAAVRGPRRLLVELRDLLVDGPGECDPVRVSGESAPGLLLNPTAAVAADALRAAMGAAHEAEAVLVVHVLAHGSGYQRDPAAPVRHLLHAWDTVAHPVDTEAESRGWDPYDIIDRRLPHSAAMGGLVLVVDACEASWAKAGVDAWSGVGGGLLSAVLAASGDEAAWDACLTRTLVAVVGAGLVSAEHPRRVLVSELEASDIEPLVAARCTHQRPRLGGYQNHNPVLYLARNGAADELADRLGLDAVTIALLLRLTRHYVDHAVAPVVEAITANRVVVIVGGPGSGKSTLAAALRSPPEGSTVDFGLVDAAAFASASRSAVDLARSLRAQLGELPGYEQAAARFRRDNQHRWDTLDVWQQELIGPLGLFRHPVRLLVDGLDQFDGTVHDKELRRALVALIDDVAHVSLIVTDRDDPGLDGAAVVAMPALDEAAARRYLTARGVDPAQHGRLVAVAGGRWLVLDLAADVAATAGSASLQGLYDELIDRARRRAGALVDPVLAVLAASGAGPVLPIDVLQAALGEDTERADLYRVLGDQDLYRVLVRTRPGTSDDRVGLFHLTLADHIAAAGDLSSTHRAIAEALGRIAPVDRHDANTFRLDPAMAYAFDALPRHRWEARQPQLVAAALNQRVDVIPSVNLARWAGWAGPLADSLGPDHPDTLTTRGYVALWTGQAGDARGALALSRALLLDQSRVLGPDHRDTLATRGNVAFWTGRAGDARGALALFQALLPDRSRVLGPDHPETLTTRGNVAALTGQAGDARGALALSQALLPDRSRVSGPDHPETLTTRGNVAAFTGQAGDTRGALALFQALLPDMIRVLGPDHSNTLTTRANVAAWTGEAGDTRGALALFQALLPDMIRVLGPDHPDTLTARGNVAAWTGEAGDARGALALSRALLLDHSRVLGTDHPDTLATRGNVAFWTGRAGDARGALALFQALLPDRSRVLGTDHPDTLMTRYNVAYWTGEAGDARGALALFQALLPDHSRVLGPDHPDTLTTAAWIEDLGKPPGSTKPA